MALISWHGKIYVGEPARMLEEGKTWEFKMHPHGPRWAAGMVIQVQQSDIIEMAAAETPMVSDAGAVALEADMAKERETLPTVKDLIATARKDGTVSIPSRSRFRRMADIINPISGKPYTDAELVELALQRAINDGKVGDPRRIPLIAFLRHLRGVNVERSRNG